MTQDPSTLADAPLQPFRCDILTLFPALFAGVRTEGLLGKAIEDGLVELNLHNWRDWTHDRHHVVDDAPFGGGPGMVIKPDAVVACLQDVRKNAPTGMRTVLLSPAGERFDQARAQAWAETPGLVLLCGRYEGFDARVEAFVDDVISIGDFVLNGGEVAAMVILEAVSRLRPGVLGNAASLEQESHGDNLLEYPHFTRPREFHGMTVPEVLLGGNHAEIARWRLRQSLLRTSRRRPELLVGRAIAKKDATWLAEALAVGVPITPQFPESEGISSAVPDGYDAAAAVTTSSDDRSRGSTGDPDNFEQNQGALPSSAPKER